MWQCPQFLFLVMGIFIIAISIFYYLVGSYFSNDLMIIAFGDLVVTSVLLIISFLITRNFEKLAEISRMKSEFISVVTHQLRSPITNLKWTIEFLTSKDFDGDDEKKEEYYSNLRGNIQRMVELTDSLLLVSKIEQGMVPFNKKEISLEKITKSLVDGFASFAKASNVKIILDCQKDLPLVYADYAQIKLAIETLIDNAIKYTSGGGQVNIKIEKRNNEIYFEVKDSGMGIPEKDQRFIFQKFFRSGNVAKDQIRGTGLGLYIAKTVIAQAGGRIGFNSKEGKGSEFYFYLPIR